jgi:hypothetical protein
MYTKKKKDDKDAKKDAKKDEKEMSIKDLLDMKAGLTAEGKPLKYPDEDSIISKIVDFEESVEIMKEVLRTPSFREWWDKNSIEGITVDHDVKIVVIPTKIESEMDYSKLKRLGMVAEEFGYMVTGDRLENL